MVFSRAVIQILVYTKVFKEHDSVDSAKGFLYQEKYKRLILYFSTLDKGRKILSLGK